MSGSRSSFESMQEIDFAAGAASDPYGFKPTDVVVDYDGSLLISDWCDGQRPKRGRGRIYRIAHQSPNQTTDEPLPISERSTMDLIRLLDAEGYHQRLSAQLEIQRRGPDEIDGVRHGLHSGRLGVHARMHAVWITSQARQQTAVEMLFEVAASDPDPRVRAQAIRAIGDLTDPVLVNSRVDSGRGDKRIATRLAKLAEQADPRIVLEVLIVMHRLQWHDVRCQSAISRKW